MSSELALEMRGLRRTGAVFVAGAAAYALSPVHVGIPCPLRTLTGIPCPLCGMTRAVTAAFRFDFIGSLRYNPGGVLLIAVVAWLLLPMRRKPQVVVAAWVPLVSLALLWAWNLTLNPTFT